jgi:undecaprenyl diphosphate synthase
MQSSLEQKASFHVAIIMDGNGRWAARRAQPRLAGHRAGVETVRRIAEIAPKLGISKLTLFAFSSDNWRRPPSEVDALMALLRTYLHAEIERLVDSHTRLTIIGRRDRLPERLRRRSPAPSRRLRTAIASIFGLRSIIPRAPQSPTQRFAWRSPSRSSASPG